MTDTLTDSTIERTIDTRENEREIQILRIEPEDDLVVSAEDVEGLPLGLVKQYATVATRHATVREVDEGVWVATVTGLDGAYGDGVSQNDALASLVEAIVGWVAVKRRVGATDIPPMEGLDLNPPSHA